MAVVGLEINGHHHWVDPDVAARIAELHAESANWKELCLKSWALRHRYRQTLELFRDAIGMTDETRRELAARALK